MKMLAIKVLSACCVVRLVATTCSKEGCKDLTSADVTSLLQTHSNVRSGGPELVSVDAEGKNYTGGENQTLFLPHQIKEVMHEMDTFGKEGFKAPEVKLQARTPPLINGKVTDDCHEGDTAFAFHEGRDCSPFKEEELDEPLTKWDYLTRWCKLSHQGKSIQQDQCYAQKCIGQANPIAAADVWWNTKIKFNQEFMGMERAYCTGSGFCDDRKSLNKDSKIEDMENLCTKQYGEQWKKATPRDVLAWLDNPIVGDNIEITCSWGTLHCDAARCQKYLCGEGKEEEFLSDVPARGYHDPFGPDAEVASEKQDGIM